MFHRAGYNLLLITTIAIGISFIFIENYARDESLNRGFSILILVVYLFLLQQYRNPKRAIQLNDDVLLAPVDGKIKRIEKVIIPHSNEEAIQLTFSVSPFNFHVVRSPMDGTIMKTPTSKNFETIIENSQFENGKILLNIKPGIFNQPATSFIDKNDEMAQGEEIGFINFDAKVTMIVPGASEIQVKINDRVKAGEHIIATI